MLCDYNNTDNSVKKATVFLPS